MKHTIRELRQARGESRADLAEALGVPLPQVMEWELGQATPTLARVHTLMEHFGVRDEQIELEPWRPPSGADRRSEMC
jgi:transcriptional regulator with XRE-family HTH domain